MMSRLFVPKLIAVTLTTLALLSIFPGCKKEDATPAAKSIIGTWKVVTYYPNSFGYYYIFTSDKVYRCNSDENNMHYFTTGAYSYSGTAVLQNLSIYSTEVWLPKFSGDTLTLSASDPSEDVILVKDATGPANPNDWVQQANIVTSYSISQGVSSLAFFSGQLFYSTNNFSNKNIYQVNATTGALVDSITPANYYNGIEFNNGKLYVADGANISELSTLSGAVLSSSPANPDNKMLSRLASTGLEIYASAANYLYRYYPGSNNFYSGISCGTNYSDMGYANGYLYIISHNTIHQCTESLFVAKKSFYVPGYDLSGIAFDGTNFWCAGRNLSNDQFELLKLQL